jgi:hypothetical protein
VPDDQPAEPPAEAIPTSAAPRVDVPPGEVMGGLSGVLEVCWRSLTVLLGLLLLVGLATGGVGVIVVLFVFPIAAAAVALLGVPAGLLLGRALRRQPSEVVHVLAVGVAAALIAWASNAALVTLAWVPAIPSLVVAVPGALAGAGGRGWAGYRRRHPVPRRPRGRPTDEEVEDALVDEAAGQTAV